MLDIPSLLCSQDNRGSVLIWLCSKCCLLLSSYLLPVFARTAMRTQRQRQRRRGHASAQQPDPYESIKHIDSFQISGSSQQASPLFSILPAEIRTAVWEYVLADYEDLAKAYSVDTCYRRPGYMGPRRTDTAVLQTCQSIYHEAWFLPWTLAQHTFYLAWQSRKPARTTEVHEMQSVSNLIERLHPDIPVKRKEIHNIQIFGQLCHLESGAALNNIFKLEHFFPRSVTICIRHTDIWYWESDQPISIGTCWVGVIRLPATVTTLHIQIESLERRQRQIDYIVQQAQEEWFFTRADHVHLISARPHVEDRWTGSSTWEGQRWIRDEDDREPGMLRYYVATITYRPVIMEEDKAGYRERNARRGRIQGVRVPHTISSATQLNGGRYANLPAGQLDSIGITPDIKASEALKLYQEWHNQQQAAGAARG